MAYDLDNEGIKWGKLRLGLEDLKCSESCLYIRGKGSGQVRDQKGSGPIERFAVPFIGLYKSF